MNLKKCITIMISFCMIITTVNLSEMEASAFSTGIVGKDNIISFGSDHSAAIKSDGSLWDWGIVYYRETVEETTVFKKTPEKIMDDVKTISLGGGHSAAIKNDGSLWIWGSNYFGELGDGTTVTKREPVKIMEGVEAVSLGSGNSAVIKDDGSLWTWGKNYSGELGDGTTDHKSSPVKTMDDVIAVSLGASHGAAIKADGSLWTWGNNWSGELGDGTNIDKLTPVKIMDDVKAVSLGNYHSAAIKNDGSLWTWGRNETGEIGDGTISYDFSANNSPVKIMDNVKSVSLGGQHSAAIKNDGSLWTWGLNDSGRTGIETTDYCSSSPVKIMNNVIEVTLGGFHSAALKRDGSLWTWGNNDNGQLGNGTTTSQIIPNEIMEDIKLPKTDFPDVNEYVITASAKAGGTISPSGNVIVTEGYIRRFTIMPDDEYEIEDILVDDKSVGAVQKYVFEKVSGNHTITATFKKRVAKKSNQLIQVSNTFTKTYGNSAFSIGAKAPGKLTYLSSNNKIAAVNTSGKVTIKSTGKVTITIMAEATSTYHAASQKVTVTIKPKMMALSSVKSLKAGKLTAKWKKDKMATGYEITYAENKKFTKNKKTIGISKKSMVKKTISKLKRRKTYYVRMRAYKTIDGEKVYGKYSKIRFAKVK